MMIWINIYNLYVKLLFIYIYMEKFKRTVASRMFVAQMGIQEVGHFNCIPHFGIQRDYMN